MESTEGVSTAFSVLLSRFKHLPIIVYYDNACNASVSAAIRAPWIAEHTKFFVDRFHYKAHKCNSVHDSNCYPMCDKMHSSNAESLNRTWSTSKSHVRFLTPANLMSFVAIRAAFTNFKSFLRQFTGRHDVEDADLLKFVQDVLGCS